MAALRICLEDFYRKHPDQFKRDEPEVKIQILRVKFLKDAWDLRNQVTPDNFLALARSKSLDSVMPEDKLGFLGRNDLLPPVAEIAFATRIGGTTSPIKVPDGYLIVHIVDKQPPDPAERTERIGQYGHPAEQPPAGGFHPGRRPAAQPPGKAHR
jgi:parvulin-like peptidyl-prolyl isomerase